MSAESMKALHATNEVVLELRRENAALRSALNKEWIKVSDRLPDQANTVLGDCQGSVRPVYYSKEHEGWWSVRGRAGDGKDSQEFPSYWRELPRRT